MKRLDYLGYIALFLATVITVASCQNHNDINEVDVRDQISLTPEVTTKGAVVTTANMSEFAVFGYAHGHADWADVSTTATSNLMFNNKHTKSGNSWVAETKVPWPDNEFKRYSFFAYSPTGSMANKIAVLTSNSTKGYQMLNYETLPDVSKQVDLVLASRLNQTPAKEVPLSFGHALSRVGFCVYAETSGVTVKSISINGVRYKGQIEVRRDADWTNLSANKTNFTANINSGVISTDVNNPTMLTGSNNENYFMLLPQDLTNNTDNTTCINILTSKNGRDRIVSYTITHNYQKGKSLLYKVYIPDGVDVVVDYTVTDWTTTNIPADIKATYLNVNMFTEIAPVTFFYSTDYTGAVTATEVGTTGKLSISQNAGNKSFAVTCVTGGAYKMKVTAGNLSKTVDVLVPISVNPTAQALPYYAASYAVSVNSLYPWSVTANVPGVTVNPSRGDAGTDISVVVNVDINVNRTLRTIPIYFFATNGGNTNVATWTGSQNANPDYYVGRFAGTIVNKTIDANTTRYFFSKQLFASLADESVASLWTTVGSFLGATSFIDGKTNTLNLNSNYYPAGYKCHSKTGWYLPAQNQLTGMWLVKSTLGSFSGSVYWSSTEMNIDAAGWVDLSTGDVTIVNKGTPAAVRCVREE